MEEKETIEEKESDSLTEKDQTHEFGKERFQLVKKDSILFLRNLLLAVILGIVVGAYATGFALLINFLTGVRLNNPWLLYLLPVGGLAIVGFYRLLRTYSPKGTNLVFESISEGEALPIKMTPLITVATAITHLLGGSAGREGAALQIGGSIGAFSGKLLKLDQRDKILLTMCGMSAAFSAMFGTPLTATVFSMEVVSIGIIHYSAIVPCAVSSLSAGLVAKLLGYGIENYPSVIFPKFTWLQGLESIGLGIACAVVSVFFCILLHRTEHFLKRLFQNAFVRTFVGGCLIIVLTLCVQTGDYNGAGMPMIFAAINGEAPWYAFFLKMVFTALTLGACYKGGEIIPTIFVGATFGCVFGPLIGIPASAGAALGICGLFCGVTNCPLASILLCFEIFGIQGLPMFLIVAAVSYRLSGYYGIYTGQKIIYSKSRPMFINRNTWK